MEKNRDVIQFKTVSLIFIF